MEYTSELLILNSLKKQKLNCKLNIDLFSQYNTNVKWYLVLFITTIDYNLRPVLYVKIIYLKVYE